MDVYAIYIREAHPADGWKMQANDRVRVTFEQPKSQEDRNLAASKCCEALHLTMPPLRRNGKLFRNYF